MREPNLAWARETHLATLRDGAGGVVGYTDGGTACVMPIQPSTYVTFGADGREHIIRCKTCLPCRRFEQHRLQRQLVETFKDLKEELWEVTIDCPLEAGPSVTARLHRSRIANCAAGFLRRGATGIALIAVGAKPNLSRVRALRGLRCAVSRIKRSRGRRAFAHATEGMLVSRDEYHRWTNRFYFRGLKQLERETTFTRASGYTRGIRRRHLIAYDDFSVRAWMDGVSLHVPLAFPRPRVRRRRGAWESRVAGGMSSVDAILRAAGLGLPVIASARSAPPSSVAGFRDARGVQREGHDAASGRAVLSKRATAISERPILNSIEGRPYSGSRQLSAGELAAWVGRMTVKQRKKDGADDG